MYIGLSDNGGTQVERLPRCPQNITKAKVQTEKDLTWFNPPKKRFLHHQINSTTGDELETWQDKGSNIQGKAYSAFHYHDNNNDRPDVRTCNSSVNYSYRWHWKDPMKGQLPSSGVINDDSHCNVCESTASAINPVSQAETIPLITSTNPSPSVPLSKSFPSTTMAVTTCSDFHYDSGLTSTFKQYEIANMDNQAEVFDSSVTCMSDKNAFFDHYLLSSSLLLTSGHPSEENQPSQTASEDIQSNNNSLVGYSQFDELWELTGRNSTNVCSSQSTYVNKGLVPGRAQFVDSSDIETRNHSDGIFHNPRETVNSQKTSCIKDSLDQLFFEFNGGFRNNQKGHAKRTDSAKSECDYVNMIHAVPTDRNSQTSSNHPTQNNSCCDTHFNENLHISKPGLPDSNCLSRTDYYINNSISTLSENSPCSLVSHSNNPPREPQSDCLEEVARNCQVCGEKSAGFHCGAFVCEACKKFFIRSAKKDKKVYKCLKSKECVVTRKLRTLCQYCRYQKCLSLGMYKPGEGPGSEAGIRVIPCRVCSAPSSGYHFGAITCEGCKGFFRRMVKEREVTRYGCVKGGSCQVTQSTRNTCKACRYQKCLLVGMSADGSRIGRQPNAVKHATQMEMKSRLGNGSGIGLDQQQQPIPMEQCLESPNNNTVPFDNSSKMIYSTAPKVKSATMANSGTIKYTVSPDIPWRNASNISSVSSNHPISINYSVTNQSRNCQNVCTTIMTTNNNNADLTAASTASEIDIFYEIVKAGYELEGLNKRSPDLVELQLEDFKDMNSCWKNLMAQFTTYAHTILKFAKKIPGYRSLKLDDQVSLLRTAMYPIIVLSHSVDYNAELKTYNYFNFTERERDLIFHFIPGFISLREHFLRMGDMVVSLSLDKREFEYLYALILLSPDEGNVIDRFKVWEVQENIAASLQEYEERNYEDGGTRFGVLIARLAEFRMINLQHQQIVAGVVKTHPSFQVPQLFSELFLNT